MMYLKWLVDRNGERVDEDEARAAFKDGKASEIVSERGWTFVPMLGLTLDEWVSMLLLGG